MNSATSRTFAVNGVIVDVAGACLRDRQGREIALRPQAFDLLKYFLENAGRLVTKDELIRAVWPDVFVTDDSLVQCVRDIRRALKDDSQSILKAVPKRGYRLVLPAAGAGATLDTWRRWLTPALVLALLAIGGVGSTWRPAQPGPPGSVPRVAVLPFDAVTEDEGTRLLAKGLTEDVVTDLGLFPELEVLARNATEGGEDADPRKLAAELDASFVVKGSISRQAERVRVTAQLVDAGSRSSLWSQRWERPAVDFFAIQTEIAGAIANRLGGRAGLVQEAGRVAARRKPPGSLTAYELYLLGTEKLETVTVPDVQEAVRLLNRAVEADPGLARAWIELCHAHRMLAYLEVEPNENLRMADEAAERALRLDPGDAEAHAAVGMQRAISGDVARARTAFDTALRMAPNAAEIMSFYSCFASSLGEAERGAAAVDQILRLVPDFPIWQARCFSHAYFMVGRHEDALLMLGRLTSDQYGLGEWTQHPAALAALGRVEEARPWVAKAITAIPELTIERIANDPRYSGPELQRLIETMRLAGFPPCAEPEVLAKIGNPRRLPECQAKQPAESRSDSGVPYVAVLPFTNVTGDEASQRLAAGLRKDLHTDLSRFREFQFVLRNSSYAPITDPVDVSFVVGGAIQRDGERLRITAQLIDAKTGKLLWSERWNRPDNDAFAIQSEISDHVANRLGGNSGLIQEAGLVAARRKTADGLSAYDLYLLGAEKLERVNRADAGEAIRLLDRSARSAPEFARAWVELSLAYEMLADFGLDPERNRQVASDAAERAVHLGPRDAKAHAVLGISLAHRNDFTGAKLEFDSALRLAPDALDILTLYSGWASRFGESEHGIAMADRVAELDPDFPISAARQFSYSYFMAGRYKDALTMIDRLSTDNYSVLTWAMHASALAAIGQVDEARRWVGKALAAKPGLAIETVAQEPGFSDAERRRLAETMQLAGFPLCASFATPGKVERLRQPDCRAK